MKWFEHVREEWLPYAIGVMLFALCVTSWLGQLVLLLVAFGGLYMAAESLGYGDQPHDDD